MSTAFDPFRRYVRVTMERDDGFVEFDFALGEPELFAEMMLPRAAFAEFCASQHVVLLDGKAGEIPPVPVRLNEILNGGTR